MFPSIQKAFLLYHLQEALMLHCDPQTLPKVMDKVFALLDVHRFQLHLSLVPVLQIEVLPFKLVAAKV